jgi:hypothetical protein
MLTDLLAAKPEEADVILTASGHASVWPTLVASSVDQVKLASLALILRGAPVESSEVGKFVESFKSLATGGEDGPWIEQVPEELVLNLAALSGSAIPSVAAKWAATEEAKLDRWKVEDASAYLQELSSFAASATAQGRSLLLWACL